MEWVNSVNAESEKWDKYTKVSYYDGYICINQGEDLKFCERAKYLRCTFEEVVVNEFEKSNKAVSTILKGRSVETLDPKSTHYDAGGIETIEILKAKLTKEQYKGYLLGNIIKYSTRANYKDQFNRDIEKINVYSEQLKQLNEENNG